MKLSVPFIADKDYIHLLAEKKAAIQSLYFPLLPGPVLDSRIRFTPMDPAGIYPLLNTVTGVKKYALLNTRFILPALYQDQGFLAQCLDALDQLWKQAGLTGVVISDFYLLNALDRTGHPVLKQLEAVPGVNCMLDTCDKVFSHLDMIQATRFKLPEKLILDRSLNRAPRHLETVSRSVKAVFPHIKIELLANEGCLLHCPFKPAHDAHISLSNTGRVKEGTHAINQAVGCQAHFQAHPEQFFKSPFIRPEDMHHYAGMADSLKLCGRTLGSEFMTRCLRAYQNQAHTGNLLSLMDATHFLAQFFYIDNQRLGPEFFTTITRCTKQCRNCRICHELFLKTSRKKPFTLEPFKEHP